MINKKRWWKKEGVRERESSLNILLSKDELSSSTKEAQIKGTRHMEKVNESIKFINEKFEMMEADRKERASNFRAKKQSKILNEKLETMDRSLDYHE